MGLGKSKSQGTHANCRCSTHAVRSHNQTDFAGGSGHAEGEFAPSAQPSRCSSSQISPGPRTHATSASGVEAIVAGVILPLVHRGQRRRVLIAGGNGATVYVAERTAIAGAVAYHETHAAGNRANPQGCPAPSFREGCLMGPKCADPCHAGRPQAALLWIHPGTSPTPEIDEVARLEADCSISE